MLTLRTNILNNATTQYTNFSFTSLVKFNGEVLGASSTGLFNACCGQDDAGTNIDAYFKPKKTDFGIRSAKRGRFIYLGAYLTGNLMISITPDETSTEDYLIEPSKTGQQHIRKTIRRKQKGRYWDFKISNVNGSDFSVDDVSLQVVRLPAKY